MIPLKKLQALYWAEIHIREARDSANHLLQLGISNGELYHAIYTGIVVSYTRSFGENQGLSAIGKNYRTFANQDLQKLHDFLIEARNTIYAHKDVIREADRLPTGPERDALHKIKIHISASGNAHWLVQRPTLTTATLSAIVQLCEFQMARLNTDSKNMLQNYLAGKSYLPGDYVLGENFP